MSSDDCQSVHRCTAHPTFSGEVMLEKKGTKEAEALHHESKCTFCMGSSAPELAVVHKIAQILVSRVCHISMR